MLNQLEKLIQLDVDATHAYDQAMAVSGLKRSI